MLEQKSDSEDDIDNFTIDDKDNFDGDNNFGGNYAKSKTHQKLNGRKIEIIHKQILKRNSETLSDEDGWTTDF